MRVISALGIVARFVMELLQLKHWQRIFIFGTIEMQLLKVLKQTSLTSKINVVFSLLNNDLQVLFGLKLQ